MGRSSTPRSTLTGMGGSHHRHSGRASPKSRAPVRKWQRCGRTLVHGVDLNRAALSFSLCFAQGCPRACDRALPAAWGAWASPCPVRMHELKQVCANPSSGGRYIPISLCEMAHTEDVESSVPRPQMPALSMNVWDRLAASSANEVDMSVDVSVESHHTRLLFLIIFSSQNRYLTSSESILQKLIRRHYGVLTHHFYPYNTGDYSRIYPLLLDTQALLGESSRDYQTLYCCENSHRHSSIWMPSGIQYYPLINLPSPILLEKPEAIPTTPDSEQQVQTENVESSQNLLLAENPISPKLENSAERAEFYRSRLARTIHLLGDGGIDGVDHQRIMRGHKADE